MDQRRLCLRSEVFSDPRVSCLKVHIFAVTISLERENTIGVSKIFEPQAIMTNKP